MKLYVNVKQAGSRKNYITKEEITLSSTPNTLRQLIEFIVTKNVNDFNERLKEKKVIEYLTSEVIINKLTTGKVSFGELHNQTEASLMESLESAYLAYEDGLYRVFIEDKEAAKLDDNLVVNDGDTLTFIKLTMLAGRLW